jgi:hypothetical protein
LYKTVPMKIIVQQLRAYWYCIELLLIQLIKK